MSSRVLRFKHGRVPQVKLHEEKLILYAIDRQTDDHQMIVNIKEHQIEKRLIAFTFNLTHNNTDYILQAKKSSLEFVESNLLDQVDGNSGVIWFEKVGFDDHYQVRVPSRPQEFICMEENTTENTRDKRGGRLFISDDINKVRAAVRDEAN